MICMICKISRSTSQFSTFTHNHATPHHTLNLHATLFQVYNILHQTQQLFIALFLTSIGLIMSPKFLWQHIRVITTGLLIVIASKTLVFSLVALAFRLPFYTALAVGITLS